jgi:hypothetical protein
MGNVSSRIEDGGALILRDQNRRESLYGICLHTLGGLISRAYSVYRIFDNQQLSRKGLAQRRTKCLPGHQNHRKERLWG